MNKNEKEERIKTKTVIKGLFSNAIDSLDDMRDLKILKKQMERIDKLDEYHKRVLLESLFEQLDYKIKSQENSQAFRICAKEGHIYGEWVVHSHRDGEYYNHDIGEMMPSYSTYWERECTRCGNILKTWDKPKEVIEEEKTQENERLIELEKEKIKKANEDIKQAKANLEKLGKNR